MSRLCEDLEKYDYSPVMGEPENGFYPVPRGGDILLGQGERIVPKERGGPASGWRRRQMKQNNCPLERLST